MLADHQRRYGFQMTADETLDDGRPWFPLGLGTTPSRRAMMQRARNVREHPNAYRHGEVSDRHKRIILAVIENGTPYMRHWHDEGDGESGPMGFSALGIRWGQVKLELGSGVGGGVFLIRDHRPDPVYGYPEMWYQVFNNSMYRDKWYMGFGAMVQNHLRALEGNYKRNGRQFVMTGKRAKD